MLIAYTDLDRLFLFILVRIPSIKDNLIVEERLENDVRSSKTYGSSS